MNLDLQICSCLINLTYWQKPDQTHDFLPCGLVGLRTGTGSDRIGWVQDVGQRTNIARGSRRSAQYGHGQDSWPKHTYSCHQHR